MSKISSELFMLGVYDKAAAYVDKTADYLGDQWLREKMASR